MSNTLHKPKGASEKPKLLNKEDVKEISGAQDAIKLRLFYAEIDGVLNGYEEFLKAVDEDISDYTELLKTNCPVEYKSFTGGK